MTCTCPAKYDHAAARIERQNQADRDAENLASDSELAARLQDYIRGIVDCRIDALRYCRGVR